MTEVVESQTVWVTRAQLADRLQLTVATLNDWASHHTGPPFRKFGGRVRYRLSDVEVWENEQESGGQS